MAHWVHDAFFYHVHPLGLCGAPDRNDLASAPVPRLETLLGWIDHLVDLGITAVYLGPVFESGSHGYDTVDYLQVDRRLGTNETLKVVVDAFHQRGLRVILDAVFNHTGRDHFAFRDLRERGEASAYRGWYRGVDFGRTSPLGDPFAYDAWNGAFELPALDLGHPEVRAHLFEATAVWFRELGVDGLRLDAADVMDKDFLRALAGHVRHLREDAFVLGEVIHGDYRQWAPGAGLDAVTNYALHKALYSSHVDRNYFELAHGLDRQFGPGGLYRGLPLYTFADNHDVDRVASRLTRKAQLYPLHVLLMTVPGVPSIYYGSEWGLEGRKAPGSDAPLRPALELEAARREAPHPDLAVALARLAGIRRASPALRRGDYRPLAVQSEQLAFLRSDGDEAVVVAVNGAEAEATVEVPVDGRALEDLLEPGARFPVEGGRARLPLPPTWGRILRVTR